MNVFTNPIKIDIPEFGQIESKDLYLKPEVDAYISETEEKHKMEVEQLLVLNREQANSANRLRDSMEKVIRYHKYKRCLDNAWWCLREEFFAEDCNCEPWVDWAIKWYKRWLELAEKFKESK